MNIINPFATGADSTPNWNDVEVNTDTRTDNNLATNLVKKYIELYEEENLQDTALWECFKEDFSEFDLKTFRTPPVRTLRQLRDILRRHGVWVDKNQETPVAVALYNLLQEEEEHGWTEEEIMKWKNRETYVSTVIRNMLDTDFGRKPLNTALSSGYRAPSSRHNSHRNSRSPRPKQSPIPPQPPQPYQQRQPEMSTIGGIFGQSAPHQMSQPNLFQYQPQNPPLPIQLPSGPSSSESSRHNPVFNQQGGNFDFNPASNQPQGGNFRFNPGPDLPQNGNFQYPQVFPRPAGGGYIPPPIPPSNGGGYPSQHAPGGDYYLNGNGNGNFRYRPMPPPQHVNQGYGMPPPPPLPPETAYRSYGKELANLTKMYTDEAKYSGENDSFVYKLTIFHDICYRADVPDEAKLKAFPTMLKGPALDYYYSNVTSNRLPVTFDGVCYAMHTYFEGEEYRRSILVKWNNTSLKSIIARPENEGKSTEDCLQILIRELQHLQHGLNPELRSDPFIHNKLLDACREVKACQYACYKPAGDLAGLINDLRSSIVTHDKSNSSEAFFTDRRYHKNPDSKAQSDFRSRNSYPSRNPDNFRS